jgi:hypothetical protein
MDYYKCNYSNLTLEQLENALKPARTLITPQLLGQGISQHHAYMIYSYLIRDNELETLEPLPYVVEVCPFLLSAGCTCAPHCKQGLALCPHIAAVLWHFRQVKNVFLPHQLKGDAEPTSYRILGGVGDQLAEKAGNVPPATSSVIAEAEQVVEQYQFRKSLKFHQLEKLKALKERVNSPGWLLHLRGPVEN